LEEEKRVFCVDKSTTRHKHKEEAGAIRPKQFNQLHNGPQPQRSWLWPKLNTYVFLYSGTDDMIFKIFSPKNFAKIMTILFKLLLVFCKNCDHDIVFFLEKRQFFRRKLAKIAENCDHNIDP
jgi:hypothetical protein